MIQKKIDLLFEKLAPSEKVSMLIKRIIYIACFVWLCYLDHIIGSANGAVQYAYKYYTGVVIGIIALTGYKLRDFMRLPDLIWVVVFCIGRHLALRRAPEYYWDMIQYKSFIWMVGIYGLVLIRIIRQFVVDKKKPHMNWPVYIIWLVMMVGMAVIRPDIVWSKVVLVSFGIFYLVDFNRKDLRNLCVGMVEGILLGFIYNQGQAILYRPYDVIRYQGFYSNANINALFYLFCYCAALCKWYQLKLEGKHIVRRIPIVLLCGSMWALTFFTMGRTALLTMGLITLIFLLFQTLSEKKCKRKVMEFLIDGIAVVLAIIVCFVPSYSLVRYVPAYVNDPIYFEGDVYSAKVHVNDPVDSEKYIDLDTVVKASFGRMLWLLEDEEAAEEAGQDVLEQRLDIGSFLGTAMTVHAAEKIEQEPYVEPGADYEHPILEGTVDSAGSIPVRMSIYKHYFEHLNMIGEFDGFRSLWVTKDYGAPHSHNLWLYIASEYGWLVGILFLVIVVFLYRKVIKETRNSECGFEKYYLFLTCGFATVLLAFGLLEMCWVFGQIPFTMFFVVLYLVCNKTTEDERV